MEEGIVVLKEEEAVLLILEKFFLVLLVDLSLTCGPYIALLYNCIPRLTVAE